jgi:hypothetical protein|nr:MAG TPA: hypothetical protein [Caudoviricetes sp.]
MSGVNSKNYLKKGFKIMLEFKTAIVNELGEIIQWCEDLTDNEIDEILVNHPEWRIACIEC